MAKRFEEEVRQLNELCSPIEIKAESLHEKTIIRIHSQ